MEPKTCPSCDGSGEMATSHKFTCYNCKGAGTISDPVLYDKVLKEEQRINDALSANVRASEYRQMGG